MVAEFPYRLPEIEQIAKQTDLDIATLHEGDLALLVHLASFFRARAMRVFRPALQGVKRAYDSADSYQTPFALRRVTDPVERHFLLRNTFSFATVNGCTGGQWGCGKVCYLAALQFKDAQGLEVVPLAQKKHFFDEILGSMTPDERAKWFDEFYMHDDNDPFDDPDLVELLDYLYATYGLVPYVTTTIPKGKDEVFERLAGDAKKYEKIEMLEKFLKELERIYSVLGASPFSSVKEWEARCREVGKPYDNLSLQVDNFGWTLDGLGGVVVFREIFPSVEARHSFNEVLAAYGQPCLNDDDVIDQMVLAELENAIHAKKEKALKEAGLDLALRFEWGVRGVECDAFLEELGVESTVDYLDLANADLIGQLGIKLADLKRSLQGHANMDSIRVSRLPRTVGRDASLVASDCYTFDQTPKGAKRVKAGVAFYRSGEKAGDYAADCHDGVILTPLGVFNILAGKVTHEFPRGRVMVPFKGLLKEGNVLASQGMPVEDILGHVVVLKSPHFQSDKKDKNPYTKVFVYDGEGRVREIHFDHETYTVIEDRVVQENVRSMDDINVEYSKE